MKKQTFPKTYHLPPFVPSHVAAEALAIRDARVYEGAVIRSVTTNDQMPGWCWRHLTTDRRVEVSWEIEWPVP